MTDMFQELRDSVEKAQSSVEQQQSTIERLSQELHAEHRKWLANEAETARLRTALVVVSGELARVTSERNEALKALDALSAQVEEHVRTVPGRAVHVSRYDPFISSIGVGRWNAMLQQLSVEGVLLGHVYRVDVETASVTFAKRDYSDTVLGYHRKLHESGVLVIYKE